MTDTTLRSPGLRALRDHYRQHGAAGWCRGEEIPTDLKRNPIEMLVRWSHEKVEDVDAAFEALVFASPVEDERALALWFADQARTFEEVKEVVEAADVAVNGGDLG